MTTETLCWNCSKPYSATDEQCPHCCATNANIDIESARMEMNNADLIDHDWKFQDDSFDHEFGVEVIQYWECQRCGATHETSPADYADDEPSLDFCPT